MNKASVLFNRWLAFVHDILWIPIAILLAYWLRFNLGTIPSPHWSGLLLILLVSIPSLTICYWYFGLYKGIWRFASIPDLFRILKAVITGVSLTFLCVFLLNRLTGFPRSILILFPLLLFLGLSAPRLLYRWFKDRHIYLSTSNAKNVLIVGAGRAGEMLIRDMLRVHEYSPVGFVDDDVQKINRDIHGVSVLDRIDNIDNVLEQVSVDLVIISIRNIRPDLMRSILRVCNIKEIECQTIPTMMEVNDENIDISLLRKIKIEDLLGRDTVKLDDDSLRKFISNTCVLVTGAGGSIGSELSRQVLKYNPSKLVLLEQSEFNLYNIIGSISKFNTNNTIEVVNCLCDVRDENALDEIFKEHQPKIVLHAAAYKHVPIVEENVIEGVKTNLFGTKKLAEIASKYSVKKFVMVSTDKAVNPTSLMGVTKRAAEIYCQSINDHSNTQFITTRFGNVLDSTGSVVPLFREQIKDGGPVTITHKDITRYFMSIPEAASLILQAASIGDGGEIFVLDMGEPIKIYDLARQMIRLAGYDPDNDIKIEVIGLRPGEKLYEELFHESEDYSGTQHPKILLAESRKADWEFLETQIEQIVMACEKRNIPELIRSLKIVIPEYTNSSFGEQNDIIDAPHQGIVH